MAKSKLPTAADLKMTEFDIAKLGAVAKSPVDLRDWLTINIPFLIGPHIATFAPTTGPRGTVVTVQGSNFSASRLDNTVTIGGEKAFVLAATASELTVLTGPNTDTGPIEVQVGTKSSSSGVDFVVVGYPAAGSGEDGPPLVVMGEGASAGDVNPIGTIRVLVAMLQANDTLPADPAAVRTTVTTAWTSVQTYFQQASYNRTTVQVDVTNFATLDGPMSAFADFVTAENYIGTQLPRIAAQGARAAVDQGFTLGDYQMICLLVFTNGQFVRAWGGSDTATFDYDNGLPMGDPNRVDIDITLAKPINQLWINEDADWGRFAHEFAHNVVSKPTASGDGTATLGEDVYGSDLVDPSLATAQQFELMGDHDAHPLFSGYHLEKLGYYQAANIVERTWDRNPTSFAHDIAAHGLAEDTDPNRIHLLKVKVSDALSYYIQVRQRPGTTAQIFDDNIPFGAAANQGGVVVTRVIAGEMHNNQQTRFIALMHDSRVLLQAEFAADPARALRIVVENDAVQARPLVCRVRVEWAQTVADDPAGAFDLNITPWDSGYQSPDVWVDRDPFGTFDSGTDAQGRPIGNGDSPRVGQSNRFTARVNVSGAMGASNVLLTFYAVSPPGVGDNGNWAPIATQTIPAIAVNSSADRFCSWVPPVGKHTCLKVYASAQFGEISGSNNSAQENVSTFQAAGSSPCEPVLIDTAVRNPIDEKRCIHVTITGVPKGWAAQLPHRWVWLEGRGERVIRVAIWPLHDIGAYKFGDPKQQSEARFDGTAPVRVSGHIPREYKEQTDPIPFIPASRFYPIGGTFYRVQVRRKSSLWIEPRKGEQDELTVVGGVSPAAGNQRIALTILAPDHKTTTAAFGVTGSDGRFEIPVRVRDLLKATGPGAYTLRAAIFDASELADAESNALQVGL